MDKDIEFQGRKKEMKKMFAVFIAIAAVFASTMTLMADTETVDGITWTYTVSNGKASVGGSYLSTAVPSTTTGAITIPSSLGGCSVTSIGDDAFSECYGLTDVTIPSSVTSIGQFAFSECYGLTSVTIPGSVTNIGEGAFFDTPFYDNQPDGLIILGRIVYAIKGECPTTITIPDGVTSIGDFAFYECTGLTSVTIPDSVKSIGYYAFYNCRGLTSVTIPDGVTSIGDYAFYGCGGLASVTIGNGVMSIGWGTFEDCVLNFTGEPPTDIEGVAYSCVCLYPNEFAMQWTNIVVDSYAWVNIISSNIRADDPTILDTRFKVVKNGIFGQNPTVKVRALAFEDGERSFAKVVRPETFVEGTVANIGDNVAANVEHTLSWKVSADWEKRLAKVKFELLIRPNGLLLPLRLRTIPASGSFGKLDFSYNVISDDQIFNALLYMYADKDERLNLVGGCLLRTDKKCLLVNEAGFGTILRPSGTIRDFLGIATGPIGCNKGYALELILSEEGFCFLNKGGPLSYVNKEARLNLQSYDLNVYRIVEDGE